MAKWTPGSLLVAVLLISVMPQVGLASDSPQMLDAARRSPCAESGLRVTANLASTAVDGMPDVAVSALEQRGGDERGGIRVYAQDNTLAEAVDIDTIDGEVRGFGLILRPILDDTGAPTALVISDDTDSVTLPPNVVSKDLDAQQQAALGRIGKRWRSANGLERAQHFINVSNAWLANQTSSAGGISTDRSVYACVMNLVSIAVDWVAVVVACGAPVVNVFACGATITWATIDTINQASQAAINCG